MAEMKRVEHIGWVVELFLESSGWSVCAVTFSATRKSSIGQYHEYLGDYAAHKTRCVKVFKEVTDDKEGEK